MTDFYLVILGFLAVLACFDLFVGVSNDAVNFLNSALGCRIATFRTTMWVASLGVLLGATFSSGMMEIARSGVFHPQMFTFGEIMVIFFAVMVSDVLLLDTFNSLGLPTSTTVSIIFELLGSALAAALFKIYMADGSFAEVVHYINSAKALTIISGILISVAVAFVSGTVVQYIARLIFTFHFEAMYRRIGGIFGGFAITAIFYFLVMKGAKGASFMRPEWLDWIDANTSMILLTLFVGLSILFQLMIWAFNTNVFRIIILSGTFSLAFAFAGNDLVNFVGVPLAALDSVKDFMANGTDASTYMMDSLSKGSPAPTIFLLLSGLVMVATLWFSKKAHRVVQTSINLSSSQAGEHEQFGSSLPGRMLVRSSMTLGNIVRQILPVSLQAGLRSRFKPRELKRDEPALPFDYVRASINLVLSSILIASATSLKLPLSTTYVTFMVAMGSSFADGAWDRETAVYRISGVLTVISGWFLTAFTACTVAGIMCLLVMVGGNYMICALILFVLTLLIRSNFILPNKEKDRPVIFQKDDRNSVRDAINTTVGQHLATSVDLFEATVSAFLRDNESALRKLKADATKHFDLLSEERSVYYNMAQQRQSETKLDRDARYCYYRAYTNMREVGRGLQRLTTVVKDHIANRHRVYHGRPKRNLLQLAADLQKLAHATDGRHALETIRLNSNDLVLEIDRMQEDLLSSISDENISMRGCELYLSFLQYARELVNRYSIVAVLQKELNDLCDKADEETPPAPEPEPPAPKHDSRGPKRILQALHVTARIPKIGNKDEQPPQ
ncbi:MAG: inorganic phosphate transporter [Sutterellaceae bacterium]|nr:inorganic phosphate transporter [Sutterellaceae bacterium]